MKRRDNPPSEVAIKVHESDTEICQMSEPAKLEARKIAMTNVIIPGVGSRKIPVSRHCVLCLMNFCTLLMSACCFALMMIIASWYYDLPANQATMVMFLKKLWSSWLFRGVLFWMMYNTCYGFYRQWIGPPKMESFEHFEEDYLLPLGDPNPANPVCYLDISISGRPMGRIELELKADVTPRTAENFRAFCVGHAGHSYKSTVFHRVIKKFMCQGGKLPSAAGGSIYGQMFDDENFTLHHESRGVLSMANSGPNRNTSQFFIMLRQGKHLDGKHCVFGQVLKGFSVVKAIESVASGLTGGTYMPVVITDCGELKAYDFSVFLGE